MGHAFAENNFVVTVLAPDADRYNADPATDVVSLAKYEEATFIFSEGAGGSGATVLTVEECTSSAGAGNTAIAFTYQLASTVGTWGARTAAAAAGYTTIAGANKDIMIHVRAADLSDGSPWVRVQTTESTDAAVDASAICILSGARYKEDIPPSAL